MQNLEIDRARLWSTLIETAAIGGTPKGGICRLSLTELDARVRAWFVERCTALGAEVTVDAIGNIFAHRPGRNPALPPIGFGSHLDTQPTGGKFDGILGVLAGLEVLRTLDAAGYETEAPLELVNWTNEEGARFAPSMMGSAVFAGKLGLDAARARLDKDGVSVGAALDGGGLAGPAPCGARTYGGFVELHIEQGPLLEASGTAIGIVTGVQGIRWYEVAVIGQDSHAGTTPMRHRRDAFQATARLAVAIDRLARRHAPDAVATIGICRVAPGSTNVIPGRVDFTIDLRHPDEAALDVMEAEITAIIATLADETRLEVALVPVQKAAPVRFDPRIVETIRASAAAAGFSHRDMVSGAGHDAVNIAAIAPTGMIFVPCAGGLSHNEAESITEDQAGAGAQILLRTILALAG
jgi:beta-ureidopropionase / N-carbamoyl-L-amino-acid hydrolase